MAQFSESDVSRAREMDLLTYLKFYEPNELKRLSRKVYSTRTHDSLKISNGRWMWWSRGIGGRSALDYLIKVKGMKFPDAVGLILGTQTVIPKEVYHKAKPPPKKFSLPKKAENNDKAVSYLMSRGISEEVINFFIDKGMLYQSSYRNNVVFVGYDENGTARYATMCSTNAKRFFCDVSGSDKRFSFRLTQKDAETIHIFESAIDLISYMTIVEMQGADLKNQHLVSLSGVNFTKKFSVVPLALSSLVEKGEGIKIIHLHLDNDEPGQKVAEHLTKILSERYEVINHIVPYGKDVNDYLCHLKNINKNFNERYDVL